VGLILIGGMKRQGFLDDASRRDLIEVGGRAPVGGVVAVF